VSKIPLNTVRSAAKKTILTLLLKNLWLTMSGKDRLQNGSICCTSSVVLGSNTVVEINNCSD